MTDTAPALSYSPIRGGAKALVELVRRRKALDGMDVHPVLKVFTMGHVHEGTFVGFHGPDLDRPEFVELSVATPYLSNGGRTVIDEPIIIVADQIEAVRDITGARNQ